ncbi:MAG: ACT domain-containing protein [Pseudomonadota bacterium]
MSNQQLIAITFLADDRPGLIDRLAAVVSDHQGNWLDSSMAQLANQFAGILLVSVPPDQCATLEAALAQLADEGVLAQLRQSPLSESPAAAALRHLELVASDRPGIVSELSAVLAQLGVNVLRLDTRRIAASMSASPLFSASATINLPADLAQETLATELEALSPDLQVSLGEPPAD